MTDGHFEGPVSPDIDPSGPWPRARHGYTSDGYGNVVRDDTPPRHPDGRVEAALQAAERYADIHRDAEGTTTPEGGMLLQMVDIITRQQEQLAERDALYRQAHDAQVDRIANLQAVLTEAPHAESCRAGQHFLGGKDLNPCDCWKSRVADPTVLREQQALAWDACHRAMVKWFEPSYETLMYFPDNPYRGKKN